ncbi:MAG TPA: hypothetical protein VMD04_00315, partial [Candidatus Margulisiibacteriota bacterium]|nr:hypothetical protein [Candidatus Margulisiibacteriota bacterium]
NETQPKKEIPISFSGSSELLDQIMVRIKEADLIDNIDEGVEELIEEADTAQLFLRTVRREKLSLQKKISDTEEEILFIQNALGCIVTAAKHAEYILMPGTNDVFIGHAPYKVRYEFGWKKFKIREVSNKRWSLLDSVEFYNKLAIQYASPKQYYFAISWERLSDLIKQKSALRIIIKKDGYMLHRWVEKIGTNLKGRYIITSSIAAKGQKVREKMYFREILVIRNKQIMVLVFEKDICKFNQHEKMTSEEIDNIDIKGFSTNF